MISDDHQSVDEFVNPAETAPPLITIPVCPILDGALVNDATITRLFVERVADAVMPPAGEIDAAMRMDDAPQRQPTMAPCDPFNPWIAVGITAGVMAVLFLVVLFVLWRMRWLRRR